MAITHGNQDRDEISDQEVVVRDLVILLESGTDFQGCKRDNHMWVPRREACDQEKSFQDSLDDGSRTTLVRSEAMAHKMEEQIGQELHRKVREKNPEPGHESRDV